MDLRILSVGTFDGISNTCLFRHNALKRLAKRVDEVNTSPRNNTWWQKLDLLFRICYHLFLWGLPIPLPERRNENRKIKELIDANTYDVVWIDKGVTIKASTLRYIKTYSPRTKIISYSPDNMAKRHNQSLQYLRGLHLYDYVINTKSYITEELKELGAKEVIFVNQTFEVSFHYPRDLSSEDKKRLGGDVGFIGSWEKERCDSILYLAKHGINVRVWGDAAWQAYKGKYPHLKIENTGLFNEDYAKAFCAFKINLCFLRKMNDDLQTTRTVEIPACGGFMLAERTNEHLTLFNAGTEADFFGSNEELLALCRKYLEDDRLREQIAEAGRRRTEIGNYSNDGMVRSILMRVTKR